MPYLSTWFHDSLLLPALITQVSVLLFTVSLLKQLFEPTMNDFCPLAIFFSSWSTRLVLVYRLIVSADFAIIHAALIFGMTQHCQIATSSLLLLWHNRWAKVKSIINACYYYKPWTNAVERPPVVVKLCKLPCSQPDKMSQMVSTGRWVNTAVGAELVTTAHITYPASCSSQTTRQATPWERRRGLNKH